MYGNAKLVAAVGYATGAGAIGCALAQSVQESVMQRQPEVVAEMDRLGKAVEILGMTAETLVSRLAPVRNQSCGAAGSDETRAPDPALCTVPDRIRHVRRSAEDIQGMLQRALNELEI